MSFPEEREAAVDGGCLFDPRVARDLCCIHRHSRYPYFSMARSARSHCYRCRGGMQSVWPKLAPMSRCVAIPFQF